VTFEWRTALPLASLAGLWWLLSDGDPASWLIGLPAVAAAFWSARRLGSYNTAPVSATALLRFLPFFLWESLRGGFDVALRTLAPRMRLSPGLMVYRTSLPRPDARLFFATCVSLLPGTLAADLDEDRLEVHVLDAGADATGELQRLESAVARVYPQDSLV
jgi:multicomponent Na+:H+ antiporter subunit E